jgi:ribosomal protein S8
LLEASLIGKALDFGSRECRFEPCVSKSLRYNSNAFLINHINFVISSRKRWCFCRFTKKIKKNLFLFKELGILNSYFIYPSHSIKTFVKIAPFFYKNSTFFKGIRLISTPSKLFLIKLSALNIIKKSLGSTVLLLSTSRGLITHIEALKHGIGGIALFLIS